MEAHYNLIKEKCLEYYYYITCKKIKVYTLKFEDEPIVELAVLNDVIRGFRVSNKVSSLLLREKGKLPTILETEEKVEEITI